MADVTLAEISAKIVDVDTKTIVDGIVLPASLTPAEFLAKVAQGASLAAAEKNANVQSGNSSYIGAYPAPSFSTNDPGDGNPPVNRTVYAVVVESPINLDNAVSPTT